MKINLRWIVQAIAFLGAIWSFVRMLEASKLAMQGMASQALQSLFLYALLFLFCFFLLVLTSYLKQKRSGTLKNPIRLFERLLALLGLA